MFSMRCGIANRVVCLCAVAVSMLCGFGTTGLSATENEGLSFEERLSGHRAIEQVYWEHRIWPKGNPGPKPAFETMLPDAELRHRAVESQRLSAALRVFWQRPITAEDLQAEIDRMVRDTTWPTMLEEVFDALGRDPVLVAECLARPLLVERRARELHASDARIHGDLVQGIQRELEDLGAIDDMQRLSGRYTELELVRSGDWRSRREVMAEKDADSRFVLDPDAWQQLVTRFEADLGGAGPGEVGPLKETSEHFSVTALLGRSLDRFRVATVVWPKTEFDRWWEKKRSRFAPEPGLAVEEIRLPPIENKGARGNTWSDTTTMGAPSEREFHTATWTGNEMFVWGGLSGPGVVNTGDRYFPMSDTWVPVATVGRPSVRAFHSAVWNGTDVVIWGGYDGGNLGDGGLYRAEENRWIPMSSVSAPSARWGHTATWSGSYMVIFGGFNGAYLGDGGRWNISTDWNPMSSTNAPGGRIGHAAVFCEDTSGPLVIWGGESGTGLWGSGSEYDVDNNTWQSIPAGALTARTELSGVYMSSVFPGSSYQGQGRVVFWGGETNAGTTATGAGYDPVSGQWSLVQTPTIEARQGHTAIANDFTMIVWGGFSGSTRFDTGGIYNPVNGDWESTSTLGAPTARKNHTAIWRPEPGTSDRAGQMIVWGGSDGLGDCDTGGQYSPVTGFLLAADQNEFETVPGGTETAAVTAHLHSLSGYVGSVDLTCEPSHSVTCTFEQNPAPLSANGIAFVDVTFYPDSSVIMADYTIQISAAGAQTRSYPLTMKVQDFDVTCAQSTVSVPPGGSVDVQCTVSSERSFDDPVSLSCDDPNTNCVFSPSSVTPPQNGSATTTLTIEPVFSSGSYSQTVLAGSHMAYRRFDIQVIVSGDLIFLNGFETGNTSAWSSTVN